jgi:hypothetical protein
MAGGGGTGKFSRAWAPLGLAVILAVGGMAPPAGALTLGGTTRSGVGESPANPSAPSAYQPVHGQAYADPGILAYGDAGSYGAPTGVELPSPAVGMAATADGKGYWLVTADGKVFPYGDAVSYGDVSKVDLYAPVIGITATPDGKGYWLYALDGGIFSFGDAAFHGSTGGLRLWQPVVGMASTPDGNGYWMVASDGGIFSFGDARFHGSLGGIKLVSPVVGMVSSSDGRGYLLAAGDGGVFSFGDSIFHGSLGQESIDGWVDGIAADRANGGYWLSNANGDVYHFGPAGFYGDNLDTPRSEVIAQIVGTPDGNGYWLLEPDAFPTAFTDPPARSPIVSLAATQVAGDPDTGYYCNPYGPCEAWCALFVTWVWAHSGVPIGSIPFVGNIYNWAAAHTSVIAPSGRPSPGDAVLYGTGPANTNTAVHTGIVAQVWPDGAIDTIEGDAGPAVGGALNVVINGPFLPSDSANYNGFPIFGFAVP